MPKAWAAAAAAATVCGCVARRVRSLLTFSLDARSRVELLQNPVDELLLLLLRAHDKVQRKPGSVRMLAANEQGQRVERRHHDRVGLTADR